MNLLVALSVNKDGEQVAHICCKIIILHWTGGRAPCTLAALYWFYFGDCLEKNNTRYRYLESLTTNKQKVIRFAT